MDTVSLVKAVLFVKACLQWTLGQAGHTGINPMAGLPV